MNQKGFIYISILVIVFLAILAGTVFFTKQYDVLKPTIPTSPPEREPASLTPTEISLTPIISPQTHITLPTALPTSKPTPKLTLPPTPTPTSLPTSPPKASCGINIFSIYPDEPLRLNLAYAFFGYGSSGYMVGAQWDFDGDGNWDTDLSQSNGTISHLFPQSGSYNVRLQLKISDGTMTNVCTKTINIPVSQTPGIGITVRLTGKVYRDANCSNMKDPDEEGIPGATINLIKLPEYTIYSTLTTDSNGNYSFSGLVSSQDNLSLLLGHIAAWGYSIPPTFGEKVANLNSNQPSQTIDLPQVPTENLSLCAL